MSATFYWSLRYGASASPKDVGHPDITGWDESGALSDGKLSGINFLSVDTGERVGGNGDPIPHFNYPVRAGQNSYERWVRGYFKFGASTNKITGMKLWISQGGNGSGTSIEIFGTATDSYATPSTGTATIGTGNWMPTSETDALVMNPNATGELTANGYSRYAAIQLRTDAAASPGDITQRTFTFQYDEQ